MPEKSDSTPERPAALTGHVAYLAVEIGYRAQRLFEAAMTDLDVRSNQYDFLAALDEFGPQPQTQLAARIRVDPARIVGMADALGERGLIDRDVDPRDRRRNLVRLTPAGRTLFEAARRRAAEVETELLATLTRDEQDLVRSLLQRALALEPPHE